MIKIVIMVLFFFMTGCTAQPPITVNVPVETKFEAPKKITLRVGEVYRMPKPMNTTWKSTLRSVVATGFNNGDLIITGCQKGKAEVIGTNDEDMGVGEWTRIQVEVIED